MPRRRPRRIPETQNLVPGATNTVEEMLSEANETDFAAQGMVPLAMTCGRSPTASDGAIPTVVGDALSVATEGTAAQVDVEQYKLRPSLPQACKKSRTSQVQLTGKLKVPAGEARVANVVEERQSIRASLPGACKKTSNVKPEDTPSNLPAEKMKPEKKPSDYQSAVARHLAESKDCAMAYSDTSFRVVRACPLSLSPGDHGGSVHYGFNLAPNLC